MSFSAVGSVWDRESFPGHLAALDLSWVRGVTLHHTGTPDLSQRPHGWTIQHMRNLAHYYGNTLGWSAGPHLFIDDDQIFGLSPLDRPGVHARSFNRTHIGIEVLGNYDREDPTTGRGAACWSTALRTVQAILSRTGLSPLTVNGHRDDPRTSKTCPGTKVDLAAFRANLSTSPPSDRIDPDLEASLQSLESALDAIDWQTKKLRDRFLR